MCALDSRDGSFRNRFEIHASAWIAPNAVVVGEVTLAARASVWYGCVLRGDIAPIRIGEETNIQDLTVVHVDQGRGFRGAAFLEILGRGDALACGRGRFPRKL